MYPFEFAFDEENCQLLQCGRNITHMKDLARKFFEGSKNDSRPFFLYMGFFDPHRCGGNKYGEYCTFYIVSLKLNFWWWELDLKLFKAKAWDYLVQIGTQSYWRHSKISNHFCKISEKVSKSFDSASLLGVFLLTHILDCGETYFVVIVVQGFVFLWVVWD